MMQALFKRAPLGRRKVFGLNLSQLDASGVADTVVNSCRHPGQGVGLVVTPNIDHIARLADDPSFASAYASAEIVTCDGFPVYYYARLHGNPVPGRVTGCDIVKAAMGARVIPAWQRMFFVLDSDATAQAVMDWAQDRGIADRVDTVVPPFGFERDETVTQVLAERIRDHRTTLLFMGVGAPKSEIFVNQYRAILPPCWALCVGQAVKMAVGLVPRPPSLLIASNLEWVWRIVLEPRRLVGRYLRASRQFMIAAVKDSWGRERPAKHSLDAPVQGVGVKPSLS